VPTRNIAVDRVGTKTCPLYQADSSLFSKGIPDPLDVIIPQAAQQYHIKAAGGGCAQPLQIMPGGKHQLVLLAGSDAGRSPTECLVSAQPDFDEHQRVLILADQVDLAEAAAIVGFNQLQPLPLQEGCG